jgi:hypothetical protein
MIKVTITIAPDNQQGTGGFVSVTTEPLNPPLEERKMLEEFLTENALSLVDTVIREKLRDANRLTQ